MVKFFGLVKSNIFPREEDGAACVKDVTSPLRIKIAPVSSLFDLFSFASGPSAEM
jgi:hypothetical protein